MLVSDDEVHDSSVKRNDNRENDNDDNSNRIDADTDVDDIVDVDVGDVESAGRNQRKDDLHTRSSPSTSLYSSSLSSSSFSSFSLSSVFSFLSSSLLLLFLSYLSFLRSLPSSYPRRLRRWHRRRLHCRIALSVFVTLLTLTPLLLILILILILTIVTLPTLPTLQLIGAGGGGGVGVGVGEGGGAGAGAGRLYDVQLEEEKMLERGWGEGAGLGYKHMIDKSVTVFAIATDGTSVSAFLPASLGVLYLSSLSLSLSSLNFKTRRLVLFAQTRQLCDTLLTFKQNKGAVCDVISECVSHSIPSSSSSSSSTSRSSSPSSNLPSFSVVCVLHRMLSHISPSPPDFVVFLPSPHSNVIFNHPHSHFSSLLTTLYSTLIGSNNDNNNNNNRNKHLMFVSERVEQRVSQRALQHLVSGSSATLLYADLSSSSSSSSSSSPSSSSSSSSSPASTNNNEVDIFVFNEAVEQLKMMIHYTDSKLILGDAWSSFTLNKLLRRSSCTVIDLSPQQLVARIALTVDSSSSSALSSSSSSSSPPPPSKTSAIATKSAVTATTIAPIAFLFIDPPSVVKYNAYIRLYDRSTSVYNQVVIQRRASRLSSLSSSSSSSLNVVAQTRSLDYAHYTLVGECMPTKKASTTKNECELQGNKNHTQASLYSRRANKDKWLVVVRVSVNNLPLAYNWICWAKRILFSNYVFFAEDAFSGHELNELGQPVVLVDGAPQFQPYAADGSLANEKRKVTWTKFVLSVLHSGVNVFIGSVFEVWLANPFPYLDVKYDVQGQISETGQEARIFKLSGHLLAIQSTRRGQSFWSSVLSCHASNVAFLANNDNDNNINDSDNSNDDGSVVERRRYYESDCANAAVDQVLNKKRKSGLGTKMQLGLLSVFAFPLWSFYHSGAPQMHGLHPVIISYHDRVSSSSSLDSGSSNVRAALDLLTLLDGDGDGSAVTEREEIDDVAEDLAIGMKKNQNKHKNLNQKNKQKQKKKKTDDGANIVNEEENAEENEEENEDSDSDQPLTLLSTLTKRDREALFARKRCRIIEEPEHPPMNRGENATLRVIVLGGTSLSSFSTLMASLSHVNFASFQDRIYIDLHIVPPSSSSSFSSPSSSSSSIKSWHLEWTSACRRARTQLTTSKSNVKVATFIPSLSSLTTTPSPSLSSVWLSAWHPPPPPPPPISSSSSSSISNSNSNSNEYALVLHETDIVHDAVAAVIKEIIVRVAGDRVGYDQRVMGFVLSPQLSIFGETFSRRYGSPFLSPHDLLSSSASFYYYPLAPFSGHVLFPSHTRMFMEWLAMHGAGTMKESVSVSERKGGGGGGGGDVSSESMSMSMSMMLRSPTLLSSICIPNMVTNKWLRGEVTTKNHNNQNNSFGGGDSIIYNVNDEDVSAWLWLTRFMYEHGYYMLYTNFVASEREDVHEKKRLSAFIVKQNTHKNANTNTPLDSYLHSRSSSSLSSSSSSLFLSAPSTVEIDFPPLPVAWSHNPSSLEPYLPPSSSVPLYSLSFHNNHASLSSLRLVYNERTIDECWTTDQLKDVNEERKRKRKKEHTFHKTPR